VRVEVKLIIFRNHIRNIDIANGAGTMKPIAHRLYKKERRNTDNYKKLRKKIALFIKAACRL
jgi:hypothetical protein